ncbi:S8 family serine peptidase [Pedobacter sp. UBA5917]|uniref:S8 family serine peptidase n=1 Tax=Pedobacter sp. UBA5917 TaxID=1947061 RepID=UPI0025E98613|nr:S8 family serine peptidase [Pedobacter sp. UBA5917]
MKVNTVFLVICFCLSVFSLNAQIQPEGIEKKFEKYISKNPGFSKITSDQSVLVRFNHVLNATEIRLLNPKKRLAGDYFIVQKSALSNLSSSVINQEQANGLWKVSDRLLKVLNKTGKKSDAILVRLAFKKITEQPDLTRELLVRSVDKVNNIYTVSILADDLMLLLEQDDILYADVLPVAKEELVINGLDLGLNQISNAHTLFPGIDGTGINLSFKEKMYDQNDLDLLGKTIPRAVIGGTPTSHATTMGTLALGSGNSFIRGLGAAPKAKLAYSDFDNLMPDLASDLARLQIRIQNHSYGTDIDNDYGIEAAAYDKQIFETDTLIHVFSAGNKGTSTPSVGFYQGMTARANLTGNFKQAKNLLVIGGINRENVSENLSSKGPAYDGRVKPELVALGEDGTSGSAAITSGSIALLEQFYLQKYKKSPSSALIRATLINSADDLGTPEVDFLYGYGKLNITQALKTLDENRVSIYRVAKNQDMVVPLTIPANAAGLKLTITWNDPPATVNAAQSLVNGLDLSLENPSGNLTLPWVLSNYPNLDSLSKPAVRKADQINTVQQVTLDNPAAGTYHIHVKGNRISQGNDQAFALAYHYTLKNTFSFITPDQNGYFFADEDNYIRWENTYAANNGNLSVSYNGGTTWEPIAQNVDLAKGFYKWTAPNRFSKAIIKMEVAGNTVLSQSFVISSPRTMKVGYVCTDGVVLSWNPQPGAKDYTLYNIVNNVLTPVLTLADTLAKIDISKITGKYFAVAANGVDFTGLKSYTIDYTQQGVSCYVRSLFASLADDDKVRVDLSIGSTLDLKNIVWEKQTGVNTFSVLQQTKPVTNQLDYFIFDDKPKEGIQFYRVTFETANGQVHSDLVSVVFLKADQFSFYPNPVSDYLTVLSGSFEDYSLSIFNILGQKVFEEKATSSNRFALSALSTGVYIGVIVKNGQQLKKFKLIKKKL